MWKERCREMEDQLAQQREQLRNVASRRNQAEVSEGFVGMFAFV
jgi:hypothetical protein